MKKLSRGCGLILILCGIVLYLIAGVAQEETKPQQVTFGVMYGDTFSQTGQGTLGGNAEGYQTMGSLKTLGIVTGIGGLALLVISFATKGE